jgi:hypothetical protein
MIECGVSTVELHGGAVLHGPAGVGVSVCVRLVARDAPKAVESIEVVPTRTGAGLSSCNRHCVDHFIHVGMASVSSSAVAGPAVAAKREHVSGEDSRGECVLALLWADGRSAHHL